jgi:two-component system, sensor histidine kinase ChiS
LPVFMIPPLSIQPLVENAICHAFDETVLNPRVTITIISYRDYFQIDVSDNGVGMDEKTVSELTEVLHDTARIGIYNIHNRLVNLFGKGIVVQSAKGVGTSVSFVVPPDASEYLRQKEEETI